MSGATSFVPRAFVTRAIAICAESLLFLGLVGCGSMVVTMEVLNPEVVQRRSDEALVSTGLVKLAAATDETIALTVRKLQSTHRQGYVRIRDTYLAEAAAKPGKTSDGLKLLAASQLTSFTTNTNKYYADLASDLGRYRSDLKFVLQGKYSVSPSDSEYRHVVNILKTWDDRLRQVSLEIAANLSESSVPVPTAVTESVMSTVRSDLGKV